MPRALAARQKRPGEKREKSPSPPHPAAEVPGAPLCCMDKVPGGVGELVMGILDICPDEDAC